MISQTVTILILMYIPELLKCAMVLMMIARFRATSNKERRLRHAHVALAAVVGENLKNCFTDRKGFQHCCFPR